VQENAPEELGVKHEIFAKLDAAAERNAVLGRVDGLSQV
jgi:3-hydroxyacyl-CoA dehydrogenase